MKRSDFRKANEVMGKLSQIHARGEAEFSNMYGDEDNFDEDSDNFEYGDQDNYAGKKRGGTNFDPAQTDIRFYIQNNIGIAASTTLTNVLWPSITVTLFGANKNSLSYIRALGLVSAQAGSAALGVTIDGTLVAGTTNATNSDLEVGSDTTSYGQIFADSSVNPMVAKVLRLNNSNTTQLGAGFSIQTTNNLGETTSKPYTATSKKSANQYDPTIIDDANFNIKLDGNTIITYTLYSPGIAGTTAGVANNQYFTMHLYRQVDVARSINGKGALKQARTYQVPGQTLTIRK